MATRIILKSAMWLAVSPLIIVSYLLEKMNSKWLDENIQRCISVIDNAQEVQDNFVQMLLVAEDHRNDIHPGIDPIAILRAIFVRYSLRRVQGASTVEQQFVRVVTGAYERTLKRKVREQLLALTLVRHRSKYNIAVAYLNVAYFGIYNHGLHSFTRNKGVSINQSSDRFVMNTIARLKYPEPASAVESWIVKIEQRTAYIEDRAKSVANNQIKTGRSASCYAP